LPQVNPIASGYRRLEEFAGLANGSATGSGSAISTVVQTKDGVTFLRTERLDIHDGGTAITILPPFFMLRPEVRILRTINEAYILGGLIQIAENGQSETAAGMSRRKGYYGFKTKAIRVAGPRLFPLEAGKLVEVELDIEDHKQSVSTVQHRIEVQDRVASDRFPALPPGEEVHVVLQSVRNASNMWNGTRGFGSASSGWQHRRVYYSESVGWIIGLDSDESIFIGVMAGSEKQAGRLLRRQWNNDDRPSLERLAQEAKGIDMVVQVARIPDIGTRGRDSSTPTPGRGVQIRPPC
jgi:hypothetical protein